MGCGSSKRNSLVRTLEDKTQVKENIADSISSKNIKEQPNKEKHSNNIAKQNAEADKQAETINKDNEKNAAEPTLKPAVIPGISRKANQNAENSAKVEKVSKAKLILNEQLVPEAKKMLDDEEHVGHQKILDFLKNALKNNNITNISISENNSWIISKDFCNSVETKKNKQFYLLKDDKDIIFSKGSYKKLVSEIDEFFKKNEKLKKFFKFNFSKEIQMFEKFTLELVLRDQEYNEKTFKAEEGKILLLAFLDKSDANCIMKIKEIIELLEQNSFLKDFIEFLVISCETVKSEKDAKGQFSVIDSLKIPLEISYVIEKAKNKEFEKIINIREKKSLLILVDKDQRIKFLDKNEHFIVSSLIFFFEGSQITQHEHEQYRFDIRRNIEKLNSSSDSELPIKLKLFNYKTKVHLENGDSVDIILPFKCFIKNKKSANYKDLIQKLSKNVNYVYIEEKNNKNCFKNLEMMKFVKDFIVSHLTFMIQKENFLKMFKSLKFEGTKEEKLFLNVLTDENHKFSENSSLIKFLGTSRADPKLRDLKHVLILPKNGVTMFENNEINENFKLLNLITKEEEEINFLNEKPKCLLILPKVNEESLHFRKISMFLNEFDKIYFEFKDLIDFVFIYLGNTDENSADSSPNEDPLISHFIQENEKKIFQINAFNQIFFENTFEYSHHLLFILNSANNLLYSGSGFDLDLMTTFGHLIENADNIKFKSENLPLNKKNYKNFKNYFDVFQNDLYKKFLSENSYHSPRIVLNYLKTFNLNNKDELNYDSFYLEMDLKETSKITEENLIKHFEELENNYGVNINLNYVETMNNFSKKENCSKCAGSLILKEKDDDDKEIEINYYFINSSNEDEVYCKNCEKEVNNLENNLHHSNNLVLFRFVNENILKEVLKKNYTSSLDLNANEQNLSVDSFCSLCDKELSNENIVWKSLIHIPPSSKDNSIILCNSRCFELIFNNYNEDEDPQEKYFSELTEEETERIRHLNIDRNNIVLRKMINIHSS